MPYPLAAVRGKIFGNPFLPSAVPGLQLWLDSELGIYEDAAMTTPASPDGVAGAQADQSGNSYHVVQATTNKKPLLKTAVVNGRQILRFDGADDLLRYGGTVSTAASGALFVVAKTAATVNEGQFVASSDESADTNYWSLRIEKTVPGTPRLEHLSRNAGTTSGVYGDTELLASTVYLLTLQSNGTAWTLRVNGSNQSLTIRLGTNNGDWLGDIASRDNLTIGAMKRTSELSFVAADFCEGVLADGTMTDANRSLVETYLADRWGITLA